MKISFALLLAPFKARYASPHYFSACRWATVQIHVDRYKHTIYSHLIDPFLRSVTTLDPSKTRFHACEQFGRCPHASAGHVVYINPVMMARVKWEQYRVLMESKLRAAQPVSILVRTLSSRFVTQTPAHVA